MSGEYAYVQIPFNIDGETIEMTELFNVEVIQCSLKVEYDENTGIPRTVGDIDWNVTSTIGSQRGYVAPILQPDFSAEAIFLPGNYPLQVSVNGTTWHARPDIFMNNKAADYVVITVKQNTDVVAKQVIAISQQGQPGENVHQVIPEAMLRISRNGNEWYDENFVYNAGYIDENGCKWIDVVKY